MCRVARLLRRRHVRRDEREDCPNSATPHLALKAHCHEKYRDVAVDTDDEAREALRQWRGLQKQARERVRSAGELPEAKVTVQAASGGGGRP